MIQEKNMYESRYEVNTCENQIFLNKKYYIEEKKKQCLVHNAQISKEKFS